MFFLGLVFIAAIEKRVNRFTLWKSFDAKVPLRESLKAFICKLHRYSILQKQESLYFQSYIFYSFFLLA